MYQFSRSLYRELAADVVPGRGEHVLVTRQRFLRACEYSMERLALDRHYFAKPVKTLFNDVRHFFPINEQLRVYGITRAREGGPRASVCRCRGRSIARHTSTSRRSLKWRPPEGGFPPAGGHTRKRGQ
jgi:hypothetical protein